MSNPNPKLEWPIRGARVDGDKVIVTVKGGNDAARWLCGELVNLIDAGHSCDRTQAASMTTTVDEVMRLAEEYADAECQATRRSHVDPTIERDALRAAVESLVAERDALRNAVQMLIAGCEYRTIDDCTAWHVKMMPRDAALDAARAALKASQP